MSLSSGYPTGALEPPALAPGVAGAERGLAVAALVYICGAVLLAPDAFAMLLLQYTVSHVVSLPPLLLAGAVIVPLIARPRAPLQFLREVLRQRAAGAATVIVFFCVGIAAFSTYKHSIPDLVPFFADRPLADLDEWLHGGPAWRLTHGISPGAAEALAYLYGPVWFAEMLGLVLFAAFLPDDRLRVRYLISYAATIVLLGTVLRVVGASAGPIFFDRLFEGDRFADLMASLAAQPAGVQMLRASDYLFASYQSNDAVFGAGISAMPSIHVAMAVLNALFLARINRWLGMAGWAFAACIMVGSVHFGWHYALDGYVSIVAVFLIWHAAGRLAARDRTPAIAPRAI